MSWHYARNGQQFGPVETPQLQSLASTGQLGAGDLVWQPGLPEWRRAGEIPELAAFFQPAAPAPYSPYAPPAASLTAAPYGAVSPIGTAAVPEYASFGSRLAAFLIDQLILMCIGGAIGGVIGFVIGAGMAASGTTDAGGEAALSLLGNVAGALVGWLYYAGLESSERMGTFGKSLLGLRVTDLQGQRITFGAATGRYFGKILSTLAIFIGFFSMLSDPRKQTWHDKWADCLVLKVK